MTSDVCIERPLFGGAISCSFPARFQDVSNIREVPDHQEVFVDPTRDESLIYELLDLKTEVADHESSVWFLHDLAVEQDATDSMVVEHSGTMELTGLQQGNAPVPAMTAVDQMAISKGRQVRGAENIVQVYLANIHLKNVLTDVLITANEPLLINPLSESARIVGAGAAVPAEQSGCLPIQEVFRLAVSSFKLVKIHSPMRASPNRVVRWLPSPRIINAARVASEKILQRVGAGIEGPLRACSIIKRREKAMENRENMVQSGLREDAIRHQEYAEGATLYPLEKHPGHGMVCMVPSK